MMPMLSSTKLKQKKIRHSEYYGMIETFDKLYEDSKQGRKFNNLMELITSENNIKLAYRNIKRNTGSTTHGVDKLTIKDISNIHEDLFIKIVRQQLSNYKPKPVRRVEIPKSNGKTRPLGIPTIWDRIIQQCILQVLEPICEAKFHERNNGFRPNRSTEHAMAQCYKMIHIQKLYIVVDIDIEGFFDNVNHSKLKKQMWTIGIQDKQLICIISKMLKAPIVLCNGKLMIPDKGTPQGGILSPLLSNIVLNELDWWIASQWETMQTHFPFSPVYHKNGTIHRGNICTALRRSNLKEMYIVRYADDFKIFCKKRSDANKIFISVTQWLEDRLKLKVSKEKSKIVNLRRQYSEFLGFKLKAILKRKKYVVRSHMSDKAIKNVKNKLKEAIKKMEYPQNNKEEYKAVMRYNSLIWGVHNYYKIASEVNIDCAKIAYTINNSLKTRLRGRITRDGTLKKGYIKQKYGNSLQIRFISGKPITPVKYIRTKPPLYKRVSINKYTPEGRKEIHKSLGVNINILTALAKNPDQKASIEFVDNKISLYAAQHGKCAITNKVLNLNEIHCHHKIPREYQGTDEYKNLIIVSSNVHILIHATALQTIEEYLNKLKPSKEMITKINKMRKMSKVEIMRTI